MEETQIIAFLQKAQIRERTAFLVETIQKDATGSVQSLKGYVIELLDGVEVKMPINWNARGTSMNGQIKYDLIEEIAISYGPQTEAVHEPDPNNPNQPQG